MKPFMTLILLILLSCDIRATIITIPLDFTTIQEGIDYSEDGDTILVLPGAYREFNNFNGKRVLLTSEQGPEATSTKQVIFNGGTNTLSILRGFTFTGIGDARPSVKVEVNNSGIIEGNDIWGNTNLDVGGGIDSRGNGVKIKDNIIRDNRALEMGGGIYIAGSDFIVSNNIIKGNIAGGDDESWGGGGIYADGQDFIIKHNLIADNQAGYYPWPAMAGGGAFIDANCTQGFAWIFNNTIVDNRCIYHNDNRGSGLQLVLYGNDYTCFIYNNIFAYNHQGGISKGGGNNYYFDYNLFWENAFGDYEHLEPGPHSLFEDPLFVDPWGGDYHLRASSPCIDAGDPNSPLDPDSTRADIGCYYYDQTTDILETDKPSGPHKFYLKQNYPNPFNGQTIISYYLDEEAYVELNIINMRGELVAKPVDSHQSSGDHSLIWPGTRSDGTPVSTGIYFYELKVSGTSSNPTRDIKAMILLK